MKKRRSKHRRYPSYQLGGSMSQSQVNPFDITRTPQDSRPAVNNPFVVQSTQGGAFPESMVKQAAMCLPGMGCTGSANLYYDKFVAPRLGSPSSWEIKGEGEKRGATFKDPHGKGVDAWDIHGVLLDAGGRSVYTRPMGKGDKPYKSVVEDLTPKQKADRDKMLKSLPVGSYIGFGYHEEPGHNVRKGLAPSRHTSVVVGYDAKDGMPLTFDYGQIRRLDNPTYKFGITNITVPPGFEDYTREKLDERYTYSQSRYKYPDKVPREMQNFTGHLWDNKSRWAPLLDMDDEQYDQAARTAMALAMTETKGGDVLRSWRTVKTPIVGSPQKVPAYLLDKLGVGSTRGITQINKDYVKNPKVAAKLTSMGVSPDKFSFNNSEHTAALTLIMLAEKAELLRNIPEANVNRLSDVEKMSYMWNRPSLLKSGEAKGELVHAQRTKAHESKIVPEKMQLGGIIGSLLGGAAQIALPGIGSLISPVISQVGAALDQQVQQRKAFRERMTGLGNNLSPYENGGTLSGSHDLSYYKGRKHTHGGILVSPKGTPSSKPAAEVEGGESKFSSTRGEYIFSDKLKVR